jgi:hypothetical protein
MIFPPLPPQHGNKDRWPSSMYETVTENDSNKRKRVDCLTKNEREC